MNQNQKGCFAEHMFAVMAMKNDFNVSMPLLDSSAYDCIIEKNNVLFKIQIKYLGLHRVEKQKSMQCVLKRDFGCYSLKDVDFFAIWYEKGNGFFIIKNKEQRSIRVSLEGKYKKNFNNFALIS